MSVNVIYLDNHLFVVDKPPGARVQADASGEPSLQEEAKAFLKERFDKPGNVFLGIVHRLDLPVQGLVLFARTSKAASRLSAQVRERQIRKEYLAVVEGKPSPESDRLEHWLERRGTVTRIAEGPGPRRQEASLSYERKSTRDRQSLLAIELHTGRKHQIRAQLAGIGHPIVGDAAYGARTPYRKGAIALLAHRLTFEHPTRREPMTLEAELPRSWPMHP